MTDNAEQKSVPAKSFMNAGPTLHYRHTNVRRCWVLAVIVHFAACSFWSMILTGNMAWIGIGELWDTGLWNLGSVVQSPLSIFEYPWQIAVLGMLMGIMAASPVVVSQLLSFRFSVPMMLSVIFVAKLPLFGVFLIVSCVAVACRPLRFRSRFIAILLCMAPQMIYWAVFGGVESVDPIRWGFSYAPWICAWLDGVLIAGIVIGVGHYTRYRPGLIWIVTAAALVLAIGLFSYLVKFDELDYQLYIAGNNPEKVPEFQDRSMTEAIDAAIYDNEIRSDLAGLFYPTDTILLREELKKELKRALDREGWPFWFKVSDEMNYDKKRDKLLEQYNLFIEKRPKSDRLPIALYYKGMLSEYRPDVQKFEKTEVLHFCNSYPYNDAFGTWLELWSKHRDSLEALEAMWRLAMSHVDDGRFDKAMELCELADMFLANHQAQSKTDPKADTIWTAFSKPAETVMTSVKLNELWVRVRKLELLIGPHNIGKDAASRDRLAGFVMLDDHRIDYPEQVEQLFGQIDKDDPLMDNVLLARAMLDPNLNSKAAKLIEITKNYFATDAGVQARFELGVLNVRLWKDSMDQNLKDRYLKNARQILTDFKTEYPDSIFSDHAKTVLQGLPGSGETKQPD